VRERLRAVGFLHPPETNRGLGVRRICSVCGSPRNIENAHLVNKGMGGRGPKAPSGSDDTTPLCAGSGGNTDPRSCHGANHAGELALKRDDSGSLWYRPTGKTARRLGKAEGNWYVALYEHADPDTIDAQVQYDEDDPEIIAWGSELAEWDRLDKMAGWKKARALYELSVRFPSRQVLKEYVADTLACSMSPGAVSKLVAWGSLTDERAALLGLTRGYRAGTLGASDSLLTDATRAADPADSYTWQTFDAAHLGVTPPAEREYCDCPACGRHHARGDTHSEAF